MKSITLLLATLMLLACTLRAQKLDSKVVRRITTISKSLDNLDKAVASGNVKDAKSSLKAAEKEMGKILSWHKGKFDESHADFVAIQKRLAQSKVKVLGTAGAAEKPVERPVGVNPATNGKGGGGKDLDGKVTKRIETISEHLDNLAKSVSAQNLGDAKSYLASAEKEMGKILSWYKGKFDESHPDFVAIKKRLAAGKESLTGEGGLAASAEGVGRALDAVLETMISNQKDLNQGLDELRKYTARYGSALSKSDRKGNDRRIDTAISDIRNSVEKTLSVYGVAEETARDFEKQYPDVRVLKNLVKNTLDAEWALKGLKKFPEDWMRVRMSDVKSTLYNARSSTKDSIKALERGLAKPEFMEHALAGAKYTVILSERAHEFTAALLGSYDLPKGTTNKTWSDLRASHGELAKEVDELSVLLAKAQKTNSNLKAMKLAKARFHETQYKGGEWVQVCKEMSIAFESHTKDKKVHRIAVHSAWDQRTEARWRTNRWIVGTYRYVGGTVLALLPDGRYRVYRISFRRTQQSNGSFGPIQVFGIGHSYEVLAENKDK